MSSSERNDLNLFEVNADPKSDLILLGRPCVAKYSVRILIAELLFVACVKAVCGYLLPTSIITSNYLFSKGMGPLKSICNSIAGPGSTGCFLDLDFGSILFKLLLVAFTFEA